MDEKELQRICEKIREAAARMRRNILEIGRRAGADAAHFGGGLSLVEITATLYTAVMRLRPENPEWAERDRFILSKGHGVLGYYPALLEAGLISKDLLLQYGNAESGLLGHPVMNRSRGIEFSTGSLGMGLALGIGVALAGKRKQCAFRVFVAIGDGECNEGSIWEGAMAAAHFRLGNLVAIVDHNRWQQTGSTEKIMDTGNLVAKWSSFGWETVDVDGHDVPALYREFTRPRSSIAQPLAIVAHTIKGKGISMMENDNNWHHGPLSQSQFDSALRELEQSG